MNRTFQRNSMLFVLILIPLLFLVGSVFAQEVDAGYIVNIYFFRGDGCPHCADEEPFLESLAEQYPGKVVIHDFEVWYNEKNKAVLEQFAKAYGFEVLGVPVTFIGQEHWVGFNEITQREIELAVLQGLESGVADAQDIADGKTDAPAPFIGGGTTKIKVPFFGTVDLSGTSLVIATVLIALVDGVNPCSLWVLTMLLAMIVRTHSRKKMLIIGFVFLTVTSLIYMLFIAGVFTALSYMSYLVWIQVIVGCVTLVLGLINLKDYFWFKEGVSLSIDDRKKSGIFQRMRHVMNVSDNIWATIGATIVLAAGVSLIEFSCTAAFPVVWSNLLVAQNVGIGVFIALLILYMVLYQLDEMLIFGVAVITMKSSKMEEKHGQMLKLFSGCLMVILSAVMIINPRWMNDLFHTLLIFGIAVLITGTILLLADKILPKFGVYIGHQKPPKKKNKRK